MKLKDYIDEGRHDGNKAEFARNEGVAPQAVSKWVKGGYCVFNGTLYKPMRDIKGVESEQRVKPKNQGET